MNDNSDLSGMRTLRLFPLPGVVFFPHCVLPLHIFEPRYRQMTADALASDGLITMVMVRPNLEPKIPGQPPELEEYGCVGRIFKYKQLPDGRYDMLLVGLKRVRLIHEIASDKLYRIADAEVIDERDDNEACAAIKTRLVNQFRLHLQNSGGVDPELDTILSGDISLGIVTDILAHTLPLAPKIKQALLAEPLPSLRGALLLGHLAAPNVPKSLHPRGFPPTFSVN